MHPENKKLLMSIEVDMAVPRKPWGSMSELAEGTVGQKTGDFKGVCCVLLSALSTVF
jgi:hypothetical protein